MRDPETTKSDLINHLTKTHGAREIIPHRWTRAALVDLHRGYHRREAEADAVDGWAEKDVATHDELVADLPPDLAKRATDEAIERDLAAVERARLRDTHVAHEEGDARTRW